MNAAQEQLVRGLQSRFFRVASLHPDDFIPGTLYHYTSAEGLLGIVKKGELQAGNYNYLNDSSELIYGQDLASDVMRKKLESETNAHAKSFLEQLRDRLRKTTDALDFYLTCFCKTRDLLSQWRGYGAGQGRYCIGFDGEQLHSSESLKRLQHWSGPVIYDSARQRTKIESALGMALEVLDEGGKDSPLFQSEVADVLVRKLVREFCFFKDGGFREENEWRLVHFHDIEDGNTAHGSIETATLEFRLASGLLRPFVVMVKANDDPPLLPIVETIVGGSTMGAQAKKAAQLLLQRYGYREVSVQESSIPFRA
jgi:hypothetical protein